MLATIETTTAPSQPAAVPKRIIGYTIVDSPAPLPLGRLLVGATTQGVCAVRLGRSDAALEAELASTRSEEHTSELQSHSDLVCRLLLEKKKKKKTHANRRLQNTETQK